MKVVEAAVSGRVALAFSSKIVAFDVDTFQKYFFDLLWHLYCRNVVVSASRGAPVKEPWWERNNPPNMKTITSVQEFVDELVRLRCLHSAPMLGLIDRCLSPVGSWK